MWVKRFSSIVPFVKISSHFVRSISWVTSTALDGASRLRELDFFYRALERVFNLTEDGDVLAFCQIHKVGSTAIVVFDR